MTKRVTGQITRAEAKKQKAGVFCCCQTSEDCAFEIVKVEYVDGELQGHWDWGPAPLCSACKLFGNYWHAYAYMRKKNGRRTNV